MLQVGPHAYLALGLEATLLVLPGTWLVPPGDLQTRQAQGRLLAPVLDLCLAPALVFLQEQIRPCERFLPFVHDCI